MNRIRFLATVLGSGCLALVATTAWAGYWYGQYVNVGSYFANGDLGTALNSPDTVQYIGCSVQVRPGDYHYVNCTARDLNGKTAFCWSPDKTMAEGVEAISGDAWIQFTFNPDGSCAVLDVRKSSMYRPKQ